MRKVARKRNLRVRCDLRALFLREKSKRNVFWQQKMLRLLFVFCFFIFLFFLVYERPVHNFLRN